MKIVDNFSVNGEGSAPCTQVLFSFAVPFPIALFCACQSGHATNQPTTTCLKEADMPKVLVGFSGNVEMAFRNVDIQSFLTTQKTLAAASDATVGIGGTSVNLAVGFQRLSKIIECRALLTVGVNADSFRTMLEAGLTDAGVGHHLLPVRESTSFAATLLDSRLGSRILGHKGPYLSLPIDDVYRLTRQYEPDVAIATGVMPEDALLAQAMFQVARKNKRFAMRILNPRPELIRVAERELLENLLRATDLLIVNNDEAAGLLGRDSWNQGDDGAHQFHDMGIREVIITLGRNGAYYSDRDGETFYQPAVDCGEPVSDVGAGDAFTTGFLKSRLEGGAVEEAMKYAATVAGIKVTRHHGSAIPSHEEVAPRLPA